MIVTGTSGPQIMKLEAQETALGDPVLEGCLLASARSFFWGGEPRVGPGLSVNWVCFTPKTPSARELRLYTADSPATAR